MFWQLILVYLPFPVGILSNSKNQKFGFRLHFSYSRNAVPGGDSEPCGTKWQGATVEMGISRTANLVWIQLFFIILFLNNLYSLLLLDWYSSETIGWILRLLEGLFLTSVVCFHFHTSWKAAPDNLGTVGDVWTSSPYSLGLLSAKVKIYIQSVSPGSSCSFLTLKKNPWGFGNCCIWMIF